MHTRDIMKRTVRTCSPETTLAEAGVTMFNGDCGVLPITDRTNKVVGVVTDRDIAMALCTRGKRADDVTIREVSSNHPVTCRPDDDLRTALSKMADARIRRIPVVNEAGQLEGIVSINDVILETQERKADLSYPDVLKALKSICRHPEMAEA